jgi:AcrR family transcriptional regulator
VSSELLETRPRLLDAAWRLLEERRGRDVSMLEIANRAGVSRQTVYIHFRNRSDLLIATTHYVDEILHVDERLKKSRASAAGLDRLDAYVEFWGNYLPQIYGLAKALLLLRETDDAAAAAWNDRMMAMKDGCRAAIEAIERDSKLAREWTSGEATDLLWTLLSPRNWELLCIDCGYSSAQYIARIQTLARRGFCSGDSRP